MHMLKNCEFSVFHNFITASSTTKLYLLFRLINCETAMCFLADTKRAIQADISTAAVEQQGQSEYTYSCIRTMIINFLLFYDFANLLIFSTPAHLQS